MQNIHFLGAANAMFPLPLSTFTDNALTGLDQEQTVPLNWQST